MQDLVVKVHGFGAGGGVRETALGEAANFVRGGLDPVDSVKAGAYFFSNSRELVGSMTALVL